MKQSDFLQALELALSLPNFYNNKPGYNLGYHWADGRFSYDCWNLIKVALTGKLGTNPVGTNIAPSVTGDLTGLQILQKCTSRSKNFSKLSIPGTYLYIQSIPHSGIYIGDKVVDGKTVNVIECTKNGTWKANGVVYSYVDANGRRFNYKGGKQSLAWNEHGLLTPWVEYTDIPEVQKYDLEKFRADVRSILGVNTNADAFAKTVTISTLLNKHHALVTPLERYFRALGYYGGAIEADKGKKPEFGGGMDRAIKDFQREVIKPTNPRHVDGELTKGGATWKKLLIG